MTKRASAYTKVVETVESCLTIEQLEVAERLAAQYFKLHGRHQDEVADLYETIEQMRREIEDQHHQMPPAPRFAWTHPDSNTPFMFGVDLAMGPDQCVQCGIGGTIVRSHMEGDMKVIDEITLREVSIITNK